MTKINVKIVLQVVGVLMMIVGSLMEFSALIAWLMKAADVMNLILSGAMAIGLGAALYLIHKIINGHTRLAKREGYLIVAVGWMSMVLTGLIPYLMEDIGMSFTEAFFETMSGMTTTGATVVTDLTQLEPGILFWRSMTQWIGGMGIIVLTVAIFPLLGIGGIELFVAEAPGPTSDKLHPRIQETAKRLWLLYVGLTGTLFMVYRVLGMTWFDSINHALTTMATGGFSTHNESMAFFSPSIQWACILFMFIAGTNYTVIYYLLTRKFKRVISSEEFKNYALITGLIVALICLIRWIKVGGGVEIVLRETFFQVISLITTTGYVTADYTSWTPGITVICFALLFLGASAGSTSGGIKIIRHTVFFKNTYQEFKRLLHPNAFIRLKINREIVPPKIMVHILVFLLIYMMLFVVGSLIVTLMGVDMVSAAGAVATSLGNVGPAIGSVGPLDNFAHLSDSVKWVLSFLMLLGRLELFSILILFTPYFWRVH